MIYLIGKVLFWLVLAVALGVVTGWFARGFREQRPTATATPDTGAVERIRTLEQERDSLGYQLQELRREQDMLRIRIAEMEYANHGD